MRPHESGEAFARQGPMPMEHDVIEIAVQRLVVTLEGVDQRLVPLLEFFEVE